MSRSADAHSQDIETDLKISPVVLWTILLSSTLTIMSGAIIAPSLPAMTKVFADIKNSEFLVRLLLTAPALSIALGAPVAGYIADRFGKLPVLGGGLVFYAVTGTSGFWLNDLYMILAGRLLLGLSVAAVMTASVSYIGDLLQGEARQKFLGQQSAFMALGGVVFLIGGGYLSGMNWRFPFLIYTVSLLYTAGLFYFPVKKTGAQSLASDSGNSQPENKGFPLTVYFIYGFLFFVMILFYMVPVQIPFLLKHRFSADASLTGYAIAASTLMGSISSLNFGRVRRRFSPPAILGITLILMSVGYEIIAAAETVPLVMFGLLVSGSGVGFVMPNVNTWVLSIAPPHLRGRAAGGVTTAMFTGMFFSPVVTGLLFPPDHLELAFRSGGMATAVIAAGIFGFLLIRKQ